MSKKLVSRVLALAVTAALGISAVLPAAAAGPSTSDALVVVTVDQKSTAAAREADGTADIIRIGAKTIESLSVNGKAFTAEEYGKAKAEAKVNNAKGEDTSYGTYRVYTETVSGEKTVRITWAGLKTELNVTATTKTPDAFKMKVSSVPSGAASFSGGAEQTATPGGTFTVTFSPRTSDLEVYAIDVTAESGAKTTIAVPLKDSVKETLAGEEIVVAAPAEGAVAVTVNTVSQNTELVAQVRNKTERYTLTVTGDSRITSSTDTAVLDAGATRTVTFTAESGYSVGAVTITAGDKTGTIAAKESAATVNGQEFKLTRNLDGTATLDIPAMKADVSISVESTDQVFFVSVEEGPYTDSEENGVNWFNYGDPFEITFWPDDDAILSEVQVKSAQDTYTIDPDDYSVRVDGRNWRIYTSRGGGLIISIPNVTASYVVTAVARETVHDVTVRTDSRITTEKKTFSVDDLEDATVTVTPEEDYDVRYLRITYKGETYECDPEKVDYIRVDGVRWFLTVSSETGAVTVDMPALEGDVEVYASTNRNGGHADDKYSITKSPGARTSIDIGEGPFYYGDETEISVYTTNDSYVIKEIRLTMNGDSAIIEPFDTSVDVDGENVDVIWKNNADVTLGVNFITGNVSVRASAVKGDLEDFDGKASYRATGKADSHSDITPEQKTVYEDDSVVFDVSADKNYIVKSVKLTMSGETVTVTPFELSADSLDGCPVSVAWTSNRSFRITVKGLTGSLTATVTSVKGKEEEHSGTSGSTGGYVSSTNVHTAYMYGVGNGLFSPDLALTRAEAVTLLSRLFAPTGTVFDTYAMYSSYADCPAGTWYSGNVGWAKAAGLLNTLAGSGNALLPNQTITRAEFVSLCCSFAGFDLSTADTSTGFSDVPENYWAAKEISLATKAGWIYGTGDGIFSPDQGMSRAEVAAIVNRMTGRIPGGPYARYVITFSDVPATHWGYYDVLEAANSHVVKDMSEGVEVWQ